MSRSNHIKPKFREEPKEITVVKRSKMRLNQLNFDESEFNGQEADTFDIDVLLDCRDNWDEYQRELNMADKLNDMEYLMFSDPIHDEYPDDVAYDYHDDDRFF